MNRLLTLLFALLTALSSFCQTNDTQDPKAKAILDELSSKTKAYTSIKAEFTVAVQGKDKTKKPDIQKGALQLKGNKYKLEIKGQEITSDGKTSWTFLKDNNEVQVNDADQNMSDGLSPTTLFTIYEKGYKFRFESETASSQSINLYPLNPDKKKFHTLLLTIDKAKKQIISCAALMKDGSRIDYTLTSFITNSPMPEGMFNFDPKAHPGVEVIDLRDH